ncbi:MAG: membrane dipeptidase [Candidatus Paceibacterota bacterium]
MGHVDLPRLRDAGVGAVLFGLTAQPFLRGACERASRQIDALDAHCLAYPERIVLARDAGVVAAPGEDGPLAAFLTVEGAHILEGDLSNLERLAKRGVRIMGFAHFSANRACRPSMGFGCDDSLGLSRFGRRLLERCEDLGVIVDLAHVNRRGFMDACAAATKPVIVSHTGVCGAYRHRRNIDDGQLRAVADAGGVVGIIFAPVFLGGRDISAVVRHLRRVIDVAGEEHVAIGSDYDGMIVPVAGLKQVSMLPNLTDELLRRRWPTGLIARILHGNALRVLREVLSGGNNA